MKQRKAMGVQSHREAIHNSIEVERELGKSESMKK